MKVEDHRQHIFVGEPDEDLIQALEPDQLVVEMDKTVSRRRLSGPATAGLWALRIFLLTITAMVFYAFVAGVISSSR